jgi:hypothetical protein
MKILRTWKQVIRNPTSIFILVVLYSYIKYLNVCCIYFVEIVLSLVETFEQLHHGYTRDDDFCPDVKLEKAVCDWTSILSCFTSFPAGKVALGQYHLGLFQ